MKRILFFVGMLALAACSSTRKASDTRVWIDSSTHKEGEIPKFVKSSKRTWADGNIIYFKGTKTVLGTDRVSACFDLSRAENSQAMLSEISADVKSTLNSAEQGTSENVEIVLGKATSVDAAGTIQGMKATEDYYERYRIGDVERIDCYVLSEISMDNYNSVKRKIVNKVTTADPELKKAVLQKSIDFFKRDPAASSNEQ